MSFILTVVAAIAAAFALLFGIIWTSMTISDRKMLKQSEAKGRDALSTTDYGHAATDCGAGFGDGCDGGGGD